MRMKDAKIKNYLLEVFSVILLVVTCVSFSYAADVWTEDFVGTPLSQPVDWEDDTEHTNWGSEIAYSYTGSMAAITRTASAVYGKVLNDPQTINPLQYPMIEVDVNDISTSTSWKVIIQDNESPTEYDLSGSQTGVGLFSVDYQALTGWTSDHSFRVGLIVEGVTGSYVEFDSVRIYNIPTPTPSPIVTATPTATPSPDFTHTVTPTITPSPTASPTMTAYLYEEEFIGPAGDLVTGWVVDDGSNEFYAVITYSDIESYSAITTTANNVFGKVQSPDLAYTSQYPVVALDVSAISESTRWKVRIREVGNGDQPFEWNDFSDDIGMFYFNISEVTGWGSGSHQFRVEISIEGNSGSYIELDSIKIGVQSIQPATPTITVTPVTENVFRPSLNIFQPKQAPLDLYYKITSVESVTIKAYNLAGRKVRTLLDATYPGQIAAQIQWDGKNDVGDWVGSGVYIIRIEAKNTNDASRYLKNIRVVVVK